MMRAGAFSAALAIAVLSAPGQALGGKNPTPGTSADLVGRATEAIRRENLGEALRLANEAVDANPYNPGAYAVRGMVYNRQRLFEEAERDGDQALDLKSDSIKGLNVRAYARLRLGKLPEAEADASQAISLQPKDAAAWLTLGLIKEARRDLSGAKAAFKKAVRFDKSMRPSYDQFVGRNAEELARLGLLGDSIWRSPKALAAGAAAALLFGGVAWRRKRSGRPGPKLAIRKFFPPPAAPPAPAEPPPQSGLITLPPGGAAPGAALTTAPPSASDGSDRDFLLSHHYEIRKELGRGGMGVVYEAFDASLGRKVAIKEMRPDIAQSARDRERFIAEARTVAKFQHPNIVSIYSILEDGGRAFLVFEHVEGESLDRILQRHRRLGPQVVVPLIKSIGDALDYSHSRKVIHRDLKPANIMITEEDVVKVMDFGIAHEAKQALAGVTNAEAFGTMAYMPPEQELGQASKESDVFAFAVVAYETILGRLPFPGPNFIAQKQQKTFERPSKVDHGLPPALDAVFDKALDPDLKRRPTSAGEFAQSVEAAFASRGN